MDAAWASCNTAPSPSSASSQQRPSAPPLSVLTAGASAPMPNTVAATKDHEDGISGEDEDYADSDAQFMRSSTLRMIPRMGRKKKRNEMEN